MLGNKPIILSLETFAEFPQPGPMKSTTPFICALNIALINFCGGIIDSFQDMNRIGIRPVRSTSVTKI
jgi:hypothetical protein